jgi:imidazole glycerol-phosphate synthase subunit HisH
MKRTTIGIIDYDLGNVQSLRNCFKKLGYICVFSQEIKILKKCDILVLPGVGAFPPAIKSLREKKLDIFIQSLSKAQSLIGVCLGMQLLGKSSEEIESNKGLGLINAKTIQLPKNYTHVGWNNVSFNSKNFYEHDQKHFYFNHSYYLDIPKKYILASARLDNLDIEVPSIIKKNNILGIQFHPEKSQARGLHLLECLLIDHLE